MPTKLHPSALINKIFMVVFLLCCHTVAMSEENNQFEIKEMIRILNSEPSETSEPHAKSRSLSDTRSLKYIASGTDNSQGPLLPLNIQFEINSNLITPTGKTGLNKLAMALKSPELEMAFFEIQGQVDKEGDMAYNARLADERSKAVINYLVTIAEISTERLIPVKNTGAEPLDLLSAIHRRVKIIAVP